MNNVTLSGRFPRGRWKGGEELVGGWPCTWTDNFWVINRYTRTRNISHQNWQSPVDGNDLCDRHVADRSPPDSHSSQSSYISYYSSTHETTLSAVPILCDPVPVHLTIIHFGWHSIEKLARSKNCIAAKSSFKPWSNFDTKKKNFDFKPYNWLRSTYTY